jgi:head-tail adaptor
VTVRHRLVKAGRIFEIRSIVDPDEAGRFLQIGALEILP